MAESYLKRAERRLRDAQRALEESYVPDAVRYCQECVEIAVKAVLRLVGIEYPKSHDLSAELSLFSDRFPDWFGAQIPRLAETMRLLTKTRGLAFYGDEERGLTPEELFSYDYAKKTLEDVKLYLDLCLKLLERWKAGRQ
ncbi:MAG: HEPN domain protein [Candidatus Bathyarchaeota archaeon BA2]|nr:MAG: HEPN domain protein [Candidatus Bathyarchaeota archaeon BA2]